MSDTSKWCLGIAVTLIIAMVPFLKEQHRIRILYGLGAAAMFFLLLAWYFRKPEEKTPQSEAPKAVEVPRTTPAPANRVRTPLVLTDPPLKAMKNANESKRNFLGYTPSDISKQFDGKSPMERLQLAKFYIGDWVSLAAVVDSTPNNTSDFTLLYVDGWASKPDSTQMLIFREQFKDRVSFLRTGEALKAVCQLIGIGTDGRFDLDHCESFD